MTRDRPANHDWFSGSRFAAPVGSFSPVAGFLPEADSLVSWRSGPPRPALAQPLQAWHDVYVVALLGEAGIGKSYELRRWFEARSQAGLSADFIDLRRENVEELGRRWGARPAIQDWIAGTGDLELFLDGVDEFPEGVRSLAAALNGFLASVPRERLRLRIASRPPAWTADLAHVMACVHEKVQPNVLSLLPIEASAALETAARLNVPGAEGFLDWVAARRAEPLASRPLTLKMLCDALASGEQPPATRPDLFEYALRRLFRGHNERDRNLTDEQRMEVASRLAGATLLSNRPFIVEFDQDGTDSLSVRLEDIIGDSEGKGPGRVEVTRAAVQETIETGPFLRVSNQSYLWSSRAYEEFLGARYLARHAPTRATREALLVNAADPRRRLAPALRGAVGWLADLAPSIWMELAAADPRALLGADVVERAHSDRAVLLEAWLRGIEAGEYSHDARETDLGSLDFDGIDLVLNPWLDSSKHSFEVVRAAAHVARDVGAIGCVPALLALVNGGSVSGDSGRVVARVAFDALWAFMREKVLSSDDRSRIYRLCQESLALDEEADPNDDFFGIALSLLWPEEMSTSNLLSILRPPRRGNYLGNYEVFLYDLTKVEEGSLAAVVDWAADHARGTDGFPTASSVLEKLLARAAEHLEQPEVLRSVVGVLLNDYLSVELTENLKRAVASRAGDPEFLLVVLALGDGTPRSAGALLGKLAADTGIDVNVVLEAAWAGLSQHADPVARAQFARGVEAWADWGTEKQVCRLFAEGAGEPALADLLATLRGLGTTPTDVAAEVVRRREVEKARFARPQCVAEALSPPLEVRVREAIDPAQGGDLEAFCALIHQLWRSPEDQRYRTMWATPIAESHGWGGSDALERGRVVTAARAFLLVNDPKVDLWLGLRENLQLDAAYLGAAAIRLLHDRGVLSSLDDGVLARWAPAVVEFDEHAGRSERRGEILRYFVERVPREVAATWMAKFEGPSGMLAHRAFDEGWCPATQQAVIAALVRQTDPVRIGQLLAELLAKGVDDALEYAQERLPLIASGDATEAAIGRRIAFALLRSGSRGAARVLDHLETHPDDARDVLLQLGADLPFDQVVVGAWSVAVVGRFCELLARHFPPPDPDFDGAHWVGPEETMRAQRDRSLGVLCDLAAEEGWASVDELTRLQREFPAWTAVPYRRMEAVERAGIASWSPPSAREVLRIVRDGVGPAVRPEGLRLLEDFLIERFSAAEMRLLIRRLAGGSRLAAELVGELASLVQLASSVVEVLLRRDRIDAELIGELSKERAEFAAELDAIATALGTCSGPTVSIVGGTP